MRVASLEAWGAHPDLLAAWTQHYTEDLLPIQEKAILQGEVLNGASVVGSGPTGCGKTFIGEMAAAHAASQGRSAFYLVPTKALAEAKYEQFQRLYDSLGLRVDISTQDRKRADQRIARGDFDIAVTVPEKLWATVMASPALLQNVGAVVVDELQTIADPERGYCLELLLTRLMHAGTAQIVGLSAVLSNGRELAEWLNARLVEEHKRPVELRKGVWRDGQFIYAEHNSGRHDAEPIAGPDAEESSPLGAIVQLACGLAGQSEPTLVFLRDRLSTVQAARIAAEHTDGAPAVEALAAMHELPRTQCTALLTELLQNGVAFHNADLHHSERRVIERAFAVGEISCLFCTPTLAVGVNLPTRNVIIDPLRWVSQGEGRPSLAPLSQAEFENMAGRAGRLGYQDQFGRAIMLGAAGFDCDSLMRRYVDAGPEPIVGQMGRLAPLQRFLLSAVVTDGSQFGDPASRFLSKPAAGTDHVGLAKAAEDAGLVVRSPVDGGLCLTGLGRAAAASGLSIGTVSAMKATLDHLGRAPTNFEALTLVALSPEARSVPLPWCARNARWIPLLEERGRSESGWSDHVRGILWSGPLSATDRELAARIALLALAWTENGSSADLEEQTGIGMGRALAVCDQVGWLLQSLARLAREMGENPDDVDRLLAFGESISAGLPEEALWLHRLHIPLIQRDHALALHGGGYRSCDDLAEAPDEELRRHVPGGTVEQIRACNTRRWREGTVAQVDEQAEADEPDPAQPILIVDPGRPDIATVNGTDIPLRPMEFQLLSALAQHPRRCISFDRLYDELWGSREAVEPQQIYWHRHNLVKKLNRGMPEGAPPIVKTIPRRGLMLDLPVDEVCAA